MLYVRERDRSWVLKGTAILAAGLGLEVDGGGRVDGEEKLRGRGRG